MIHVRTYTEDHVYIYIYLKTIHVSTLYIKTQYPTKSNKDYNIIL